MPRIGRTHHPQVFTGQPTIVGDPSPGSTRVFGGFRRSGLGAFPPVRVGAVFTAPAIQVNQASDLLRRRYVHTKRFPAISQIEGTPVRRLAPPNLAVSTISLRQPQIGPKPPKVLAPTPVVTTLSVNIATGVLTNWRRVQQRRTSYQGQDQRLVLVRPPTTGTAVFVLLPRRRIGPFPPVVINVAFTAPPINTGVTIATGVLTNWRRAQQRRTCYLLSPPRVTAVAPLAPPITVATAVDLLRRRSMTRRFLFGQGHDETEVFLDEAGPFPSTPVLDIFDYGAGVGALGGLGDWVAPLGGIASQLRYNDSGNRNVNSSNGTCSDYTGTTYGPDCEAYVTIDNINGGTLNASNQLRVYVRVTNPTLTGAAGRGGYNVGVTAAGSWTLEKQTTGGTVVLDTFSQAIAVGDKVGIRAIGDTISAWWFDSTGDQAWHLVGSVSDSQWPTAGVLALALNGSGTGWTIGTTWQADDFGGGDIGGGTGLLSVLTRRRIGPFPPILLGPVFTAPPLVVSPAVDLLRRHWYTRRFPLQGWEQDPAFEPPLGTPAQQTLSSGGVGAGSANFGVTAQPEVAQKFSRLRGVLTSASFYLGTSGSPSDDAVVEVQSDSGGQPSGVVLATSNTVAGSSLGVPLTLTTFSFPSPLEVTGLVWLVLRRTGALDDVNFYVGGTASGRSAEGPFGRFDGVTWQLFATNYMPAIATFTPFAPQCLLQRRFLGPRPPLVILPLPSEQQTTIFSPSGTAMRAVSERLARLARPTRHYLYAPTVLAQPPPPPGQYQTKITLAVQARRLTEARRFPLQGWEQRPCDFSNGNPYPLSPQTIRSVDDANPAGSEISWGRPGGLNARMATYLPTLTGKIQSATIFLDKVHSPTDNVVVEIQSDADGVPSGVVLAAATPVAGSSLPTVAAAITFNFPTSGDIIGPAWLVVYRDGALDNTNYYDLGDINPNYLNHTTGREYADNGVEWSYQFSTTWVVATFVPFAEQVRLQSRFLGPRPPLVILPLPSEQQTTITAAPGAAFAAMYRRATEKKRFPLQGWEGVFAYELSGTSLAPLQSPSLSVLDNFDRANEDPLSGGGRWATISGGGTAKLVSNQTLRSTGAGQAYWTLTRFADCEAFATITVLPAVSTVRVLARVNPSTGEYYEARYSAAGAVSLFRVNIGGGSNQIGSTFNVTLSAGDKLAIRCVGSSIEAWIFTGGTWTLAANDFDYAYGSGYLGLGIPDSTGALDDFSGGGTTVSGIALTQPLLGVRRPQVISPFAPVRTTVFEPTGTAMQAVAARVARSRKPMYDLFGFIPQVSAQPPPPIAVYLASGLYTNQRRYQQRRPDSFLGRPLYLSPLAVVTTPGQLAIREKLVRARSKPFSRLANFVVSGQVFYGPQINLLPTDRLARRHRRIFAANLYPPTVLQTFSGPKVTLARTRPRPTRSQFIEPATLEPESIFLAERQPRVVLVHTRPRRTISRLGPLIFYAQTSEISVTVVRTRSRPTTHRLTPPTVVRVPSVEQREQTISVTLVRVRPRPTTSFVAPPATLVVVAAYFYGPKTPLVQIRPRPTVAILSPPATLEPESVAIAERTIRVVLTRARPRPTTRRLTAVTYPATSEIAVALVHARPRPTAKRLTAVSYPQAGVGFTHLVRARPRPTIKFVQPPSTLQPYAVTLAEDTVRVSLTRTRPRPTTKRIQRPTTLQVFAGPSITLVHTRPRPTRRFLTAIAYAATSEITVALVDTRPRPTTHALSAITYPQTSEILVALVRTRSKPLTRYVAPPATLQPYSITLAEDTIRVVLVRTRPRHTQGTELVPPTVLQTFAGPVVHLVTTRPRPTIERLLPPRVVHVPSVAQQQQTIRVALVETRPRPTTSYIVPPVVRTFPPVVTTLLPAHLIRTRPRPTRKFLAPPTRVIPLPTLRMQTITVAQTRIRPRKTRRFLTPLIFYRATSEISVTLVRARPRKTSRFLFPPKFYKATSEILVKLVQTRPRPTVHQLTAVRYEQTSQITVKLVTTRPRPTTSFVRPPQALQVFGPPEEVEIAVRTPVEDKAHRRARSFFIQPVTYPATSRIRVVLTRTRPQPTTHRLSAVTYRATSEISVTLASLRAARPRPTTRFLRPSPVLRVFTAPPPQVHLTRTRPRPTTHRLAPPTKLAPVETTIRVKLARIRPPHVRTVIVPPTVVRAAFVAPPITVKLVTTRPRPIRSAIFPPTTLQARFVFIAEPIRVVRLETRPPQTRWFYIRPARIEIVPGVPGFTCGVDVVTDYGCETDIATDAGTSTIVATDAGAASDEATTSGTQTDIATDAGTLNDQPGGLP